MSAQYNEIPVVILCGGKGLVLHENQSQRINKALVRINGKPMFWWVVMHYAIYGAQQFLLPTELQADIFRSFLMGECEAEQDKNDENTYYVYLFDNKISIYLVLTAPEFNTAQRLLACKPYLYGSNHFALTYSDTLSDVDLNKVLSFHLSQGTVATLVSTQYPVRFRILGMRYGESTVRAFASKPVIEAAAINGGFYLFTNNVWDLEYSLDGNAPIESVLLDKLVEKKQLTAYQHNGQWQHCDAERDIPELTSIAIQIASRSGE